MIELITNNWQNKLITALIILGWMLFIVLFIKFVEWDYKRTKKKISKTKD